MTGGSGDPGLGRCYSVGLAGSYAALIAGCSEVTLELYSSDLGPHMLSGRFTLSPSPLPRRARRLFPKTGAFWVFCDDEAEQLRNRWISSGLGVVDARPEQLSVLGASNCKAYYAPDDYLAPPSLAFARATAIVVERRGSDSYDATIEVLPCSAHVAVVEFDKVFDRPILVLNGDQSFAVVPVRKRSKRAYIYSTSGNVIDNISATRLLAFSVISLGEAAACKQCVVQVMRERRGGKLVLRASNCDSATVAKLLLEALRAMKREESLRTRETIDYPVPLPWSMLG